MKLIDLLREDCILIDFTAKDKFDAIDKMVGLLVQRGRIPPGRKRAVLDALIAREKIASTGLENGIALPHATVGALEECAVAVAISPTGVNFHCQDGKPAHLLVLIVIPQKLKQQHVRTLANTAKLLNYEEIRTALLNARTPREVLQVIREEEAKEFA